MSDSTLPTESFSLPNLNWDFLIDFADGLAAKTETKIDDLAVDILRFARGNETIRNWLAGLVSYAETQPSGTLSFTADPPEAVVEALRAGGIFKTARDAGEIVTTLKDLLPYVVQIVAFVRMITGK